MRKVHIKIPILINTDVLHVKEDIVKIFDDDLLVSIDYEEEPNINKCLLTLAEQQRIIRTIQSINENTDKTNLKAKRIPNIKPTMPKGF